MQTFQIMVMFMADTRVFSDTRNKQTDCGPQAASCSMCFGRFIFLEKRREAKYNRRLFSSAQVQNEWSCTFNAPNAFVMLIRKTLIYFQL